MKLIALYYVIQCSLVIIQKHSDIIVMCNKELLVNTGNYAIKKEINSIICWVNNRS